MFSYIVNSEFVTFRLSPVLGMQSPDHCDFVAGTIPKYCVQHRLQASHRRRECIDTTLKHISVIDKSHLPFLHSEVTPVLSNHDIFLRGIQQQISQGDWHFFLISLIFSIHVLCRERQLIRHDNQPNYYNDVTFTPRTRSHYENPLYADNISVNNNAPQLSTVTESQAWRNVDRMLRFAI